MSLIRDSVYEEAGLFDPLDEHVQSELHFHSLPLAEVPAHVHAISEIVRTSLKGLRVVFKDCADAAERFSRESEDHQGNHVSTGNMPCIGLHDPLTSGCSVPLVPTQFASTVQTPVLGTPLR